MRSSGWETVGRHNPVLKILMGLGLKLKSYLTYLIFHHERKAINLRIWWATSFLTIFGNYMPEPAIKANQESSTIAQAPHFNFRNVAPPSEFCLPSSAPLQLWDSIAFQLCNFCMKKCGPCCTWPRSWPTPWLFVIHRFKSLRARPPQYGRFAHESQ